ncbi:ABC transporter substrate-binding protein [Gluconacetobacter tumulisoli]|uniref:Putative aliphatic sulfonates-binding protein n=1 Tax=Gluconacetobacter tumulisoli TaxID=1286189 RepID=A0A7W4PJQ1_9PROT|nr:ABC transporter substrate-binding protein [Gluconacetobacter tumulisoli]MBB2200587.1 ABC transporter substrate-binding protein [Gluconacetobacter tumulisoli]
MIPVGRRRLIQALAAVASPIPSRAWAAGGVQPVAISYQRSSAVMLALQANPDLATKFGASMARVGLVPHWYQFTHFQDAMISDSIQIQGDSADAVPIFAQAAHAPLTYLAQESPSPTAEALIVHATDGIDTIAGLRGKRIAVARGSGCHYLLVRVLRDAGLTPGDVHISFLEPPQAAAAFAQKSVDGWAIWDPFLAVTQARIPVRVLCDGRGVTEYYRFYMIDNAFALAHPEAADIMYTALREASDWLRAHPDDGARLLSPAWGNMPQDIVRTITSRRSLHVEAITPAALAAQQRIADAFTTLGLVPGRVDISAMPVWRAP